MRSEGPAKLERHGPYRPALLFHQGVTVEHEGISYQMYFEISCDKSCENNHETRVRSFEVWLLLIYRRSRPDIAISSSESRPGSRHGQNCLF